MPLCLVGNLLEYYTIRIMNRILLLLLLLVSYANAQTWQPTSIRQRFVNGIGIPTRDTISGTAADSSQLVLRPQDSVIYYKYKGYWRALASGGSVALYTSTLKHEVKAAVAITKGHAVYVSSANGTNIIVSKADNTTEQTSSKTMGLLESTVAANGKTFVITEGLLAGLNTSMAAAGDAVWLGTNGDLLYGIANKPKAPAHMVFIGIVTRSNVSNGEIFVKVQNGFELDELHDVAISSPRNQSIILYDSVNKLWRDTLASVVTANKVNYTDTAAMLATYLRSATATATYEPKITAGTTAQYWRGDKSWQTLPIYTLSGLGGQPQLNGTGFVKASGTTISYDNNTYYLASNPNGYTSNTGTVTSVGGTGTVSGLTLSGTVTSSGNLTLGGALSLTSGQITTGLGYTPYNATNPNGYTTNTGTVTSIATTAPLTGGTITTSGTLGITQSTTSTSGYLSSTDWNTFNGKQNALTNPTTGTGTTNYVTKWTGSSTLGNSSIFDNGTNVGIGTASPAQKLDVNGSINSTEYRVNNIPTLLHTNVYTALRDPGNSNTLLLGDANEPVNYYSNSQHIYRNRGGSAEYLRITSAGNVGIGTVSPTQRLTVDGNIEVVGTGKRIYGDLSNAGVVNRLSFQSSTTNGSTLVNAIPNGTSTASSFFTFNSSDPSNSAYLRFGTTLSNMAIIETGVLGTGVALPLAVQVNGSERLRVTTAGNVLIGSTTDDGANKLQVTGNVKVTGSITATLGGFNSDINDKTNLIYGAKKEILNLNAVSYLRKSTNSQEYGYIAQEVKKYLPEAVYSTTSGLAVSYHMVNAAKIQALQDEVEDLKNQIKELIKLIKK